MNHANAQTVVLVGIGHTHAHIVRKWAKSPPAGARLVCVSPYEIATYSGMLPGTLSRQYQAEQMQIPLKPLCDAADAKLHVSAAVAVDVANRTVTLANGQSIAYDLLSIGIGSVPSAAGVDIAEAAAEKVKPMQTLLPRLDDQLREAVAASQRAAQPLRIAIVGGGAAGVEIAFCLDRRLELDYPNTQRVITLVDSHTTVLASERMRTQRLANGLLKQRGIQLRLGERVTEVQPRSVGFDSGESLSTDLVIWAVGASPPKLLQDIDLPNDDAGFLLTEHTLQSKGDARIFVVGDTGTIAGESYAKAGVYAVREGPVLWKNLNVVLGGGKLEEYHPQQKFLRLFNTADGRAIIDYHGLVMHGRWCWWLKDWIDRSFVAKYQVK